MRRFAAVSLVLSTLALSACSRCNRESPTDSHVPDAIASIPIPEDAVAPPSSAGSAAAASSSSSSPAASGSGGKAAAPVPDVKRIDDTHYEVSRSMRDALVADPERFGAGTRAIPSFPSGVRLLSVAGGSTAARMGLRSGDVVESVEGAAIPRSAADARARARKSNPVHVTVTRGGATVTLVYTVVG